MHKIFGMLILGTMFFGTPVLAGQIASISMDNAEDLKTKIVIDRDVKVEGEGAVKIESGWPTTVALAEVQGLSLDSTKLVYRAKVKSEALIGSAYLEMWVWVDGKSYFSKGVQSSIKGTSDWKTLETPFILQKGQTVNLVSLNLVINGRGTVWIDDLSLDSEPLIETAK